MSTSWLKRAVRCLTVTLLVGLALPLPANAENLDAALSFTEVQDQDAPTPRVFRQARHLDLSVVDQSRVREWSARRFGQPTERIQDLEVRVGIPTSLGKATLLWRVQEPAMIVRELEYPSYVETITVSLHPDGCEATVAYHLRSGYTHFGMWSLGSGAPLSISRLRAEDVRCKLGSRAVS